MVGVVDEAVHLLAAGDAVDEVVEEHAVAADDVDVGALEGLSQHGGLLGGDVALDVDAFEIDLELFVQTQLELFVFLAHAVELLHGLGLAGHALGLGGVFLTHDFGFGGAVLVEAAGLGVHDLGLGEPGGGFFGLHGLGHLHLGLGFFFGGLAVGFGFDQDLVGLELAGELAGFGFLHFLDLVFFGAGGGGGHRDGLGPLGGHDLFGVFDLFLLFDHGPFNHHAFADDVLDELTLFFEGFFFGDVGQFDHALAFGGFEAAFTGDTLGLDRVGFFFGFLGNEDLTQLVLFGDAQLFLGADAGLFAFVALFFFDFVGLGFFAGSHAGDLAGLLGFGFFLLAFQFEDGLAGFDVLLLDGFLFFAGDVIRQHGLFGGEVGDLFDALGVEDVVGVELGELGLFQVVDGGVVQHVAVEVGAQVRENLVFELLAFGVELGEVEAFAHGFQGFGELRVEELNQRLDV